MEDQREYYPNKPLATTVANRLQTKYEDKGVYSAVAQFEPNKGYVVVLFAENNIPEAWADGAEVVTQQKMTTPEKTPDNWSKGRAKGAAPAKGGPATTGAPKGGTTARVWAIADAMHAESPLTRQDRAKVIAQCTSEGINSSTAGTQWSKWAKARGL